MGLINDFSWLLLFEEVLLHILQGRCGAGTNIWIELQHKYSSTALEYSNGIDPQPYLPESTAASLTTALDNYTDNIPDIEGIKLLGIPVGRKI